MKKITISFLCGLALAVPSVIAAGLTFPDVKPTDWFHQYVMQIKDWGVVGGNDDGTFAPSRNINRAEFAKMLSRYDERVDEKIRNSSSAGGGKDYSVLYLEKFNGEPSACPSGWKEAQYAKNWEDGGRHSYERVCYTDRHCDLMYLEAFNSEPNHCPIGWQQADYGEKWSEGGQGKFRRTCYVCS